jgi:shikimate kinase
MALAQQLRAPLAAAAAAPRPRAASAAAAAPPPPPPPRRRALAAAPRRASASAARAAGVGFGAGASSTPEDRFEADNARFAALTARVDAEAAAAAESLAGTSLYLVGLMGSGKSTVGRLLAAALRYCFFDVDALVEAAAGKPVARIFAEDGEEAFRAAETAALAELAAYRDCVIATGGGAPCSGVNWGHMAGGVSVWLNGPPELLARRVLGQDGGASRPLLAPGAAAGGVDGEGGDEEARVLERVRGLLEARRAQYGFADITVSLEGEDGATAALGAPPAAVALRVMAAVTERVRRDAAERAERSNFKVQNDALPPSMRSVSINPAREAPGGGENPYMP